MDGRLSVVTVLDNLAESVADVRLGEGQECICVFVYKG
jgi:hypothetical protein